MIRRSIGRAVLWYTRWSIAGEPPATPKYVLIAAPHTTNWDLLYLLALSYATGVHISWLGKDTLFRGPVGSVLRALGGVPVVRDQRSGLVDSLAVEFAAADRLVLVVPPEGTRGRTDHWRTGFYRIACAADVPIVCGYLDYSRRTGGFGPVIEPSGDIAADLPLFQAFYADKQGKYPAEHSDIALRPTDATYATDGA
jgi:1-acyl-sn-glycerol-3-phosphate acyltransferase